MGCGRRDGGRQQALAESLGSERRASAQIAHVCTTNATREFLAFCEKLRVRAESGFVSLRAGRQQLQLAPTTAACAPPVGAYPYAVPHPAPVNLSVFLLSRSQLAPDSTRLRGCVERYFTRASRLPSRRSR